MKILAVDTCLGACSAAVLSDDAVLAHRHVAMERGHAEALAPMVEEVMHEAKLAFAGLDRLGVTTGPGTFTGQRVGLAFMRGLRVGLKRPLAGVTSLLAIAVQAMDETKHTLAAVIHDARRDEVYVEIASRNGSLAQPAVMRFDEAAAMIAAAAKQESLVVAGTAAKRTETWCRARGMTVAVADIAAPDAIWVARLCAKEAVSDTPPKPLYLRAPDAKLPAARPMIATTVLSAANTDYAALSVLHGAAFSERWSGQSIKGLLETPGTFAIAAGTTLQPDGFVMARVAADEAEILTIAVAEHARRRGVGAALVGAAARHASDITARTMFLEVGQSNEAARALYAKLGFLEVGQRKGYYRDGPGGKPEDALTLRAPLPLGKNI